MDSAANVGPLSRARRSIVGVIVVAAVVSGALASCAGRRFDDGAVPAPTVPRFTLASSLIVPVDRVPGARFGGVSGLAYDEPRGEWIAVSDDHSDPRWFVCRFREDGDRLQLVSSERIAVKLPAGAAGIPEEPDFEAVTVLPDGDVLVASEGLLRAGRRTPASILRFRRDGSYVGPLTIPPRYLPSAAEGVRAGMRDNHGFEGLALSRDGSRLWAVAETPLLQDDDLPSTARGARSRLLEFALEGGTFRAARELVYPIDRVTIPSPLGPAAEVVDQGVAELTVLSDGTLLSLERAFVRDRSGLRSANVIRIFMLQLDGADDVSSTDSLRDAPGARPIRKTLIRDLASVATGLPRQLATLDNFEAMAPGPRLASGPSLLMMSDDNFSPRQVTAAILLRRSEDFRTAP